MYSFTSFYKLICLDFQRITDTLVLFLSISWLPWLQGKHFDAPGQLSSLDPSYI